MDKFNYCGTFDFGKDYVTNDAVDFFNEQLHESIMYICVIPYTSLLDCSRINKLFLSPFFVSLKLLKIPKKMTLKQIEKELGYKVEIVSE